MTQADIQPLCERLRVKEGGWMKSVGEPDAKGFLTMEPDEPRLRNPDGPEAASVIEQQAATIEGLFDAIKHGDDDHQGWLKEAIAAHFAGKPVPPTRGGGRKEARIAELVTAIEGLREGLDVADTALCLMQDTWLDYHDSHSLTEHVTGRAGNAYDRAADARDKIKALLKSPPPSGDGK